MTHDESGHEETQENTNPWDDLTEDQLAAVLEDSFVHVSATPERGSVFRPAKPLSAQSALLRALPDTADRDDAADWLSNMGGAEELLSLSGARTAG